MDKLVTSAWLRGGAGVMRDRRAPRGGASNTSRDLLAEALDLMVDEVEVEVEPASDIELAVEQGSDWDEWASLYSDLYKDRYGFRPRQIGLWTIAEIQAAIDDLPPFEECN